MAKRHDSIDGNITIACYIESLLQYKQNIFMTNKTDNLNGEEDEKEKPTYHSLAKELGLKEDSQYQYLVDIRNHTIPPSIDVYLSVKTIATEIIRGTIQEILDIEDPDFEDVDDVEKSTFCHYLSFLKQSKVDTEKYLECYKNKDLYSAIDQIDDDVTAFIYNLFDSKNEEPTKEASKEYPIRVLIDYDDRSVVERINSIISNIQRDHANPIILASEFSDEDVDKYDLYYIISNTVSGNAIKTIKALSNGSNLHCIKVFSKDESFLQDKAIKKQNTNIRLIYDQNAYMYEIYADLMEIIEQRDADTSEFLSEMAKKLDRILKSDNPSQELDAIDSNLLRNPISLYDRKSVFYRQFIDEYISEQRKIAKHILDRFEDIYKELIDMAAMYDIQMDVYLDYARYLFDVKNEKQHAIEYADKYRRYMEYTGQDENNVEMNTLLGKLYNKARNLDLAVECFSKAQNVISPDREKELSELIGLRASCLWEASRLSEAEEYLEEYLPYVEKCYRNNPVECKEGMAKTYKAKGNIIHAKRELESARVYFIKALKVWLNDPEFKEIEKFDISKIDISSLSDIPKREIASICNNLAILNRRKKEYSESLKYYDFCLRIREEAYEKHKNDNKNIDDYLRAYAVSKANKATLLWQMDETDNSVSIETKELFVQSVELKKQINEKDNRFYVSMYNSYIEEAKFEINQGYYKGAAEKIDKAEKCIEKLISQKGDNTQIRFRTTINCWKAKLEMKSLEKGNNMPSKECGDLLMSAFKTYQDLNNRNKSYYLEEIVDTAIDLFEYYKLTGNGSEEDIAMIYGAALPAANKLGKGHDVYASKATEIKKLKNSL